MTLIVYGPTVTGKTTLALAIAKKYNCEIISADSRQIYKGLDIGTGKVSFKDNVEKHKDYWLVNGKKIYGFDIAKTEQAYSAQHFTKYARKLINKITKDKKTAIISGGSGFYIKALVSPIESSGIEPDKKIRHSLEKLSVPDLYLKLNQLDPFKAKSMNKSDRNNPRRLVRAIEIAKTRNKNTKSYKLPNPNYHLLGLTAPNKYLFLKADLWLAQRLKNGLVDEVKGLLQAGVSQKWLDDIGLEYRWLKRHLVDHLTYDEAIERLRGDIHNLIRKQKTFFNQFPNIKTYDVSKRNWQNEVERDTKKLLGRS